MRDFVSTCANLYCEILNIIILAELGCFRLVGRDNKKKGKENEVCSDYNGEINILICACILNNPTDEGDFQLNLTDELILID